MLLSRQNFYVRSIPLRNMAVLYFRPEVEIPSADQPASSQCCRIIQLVSPVGANTSTITGDLTFGRDPSSLVTARGYAKRGICRRRVSVCLSVCHTPVLYQNG